MNVIVLAGGLGTRLKSIVSDVPKPMADIDGTPFLELLLENLAQQGAKQFILCVSHLREVIIQHFGNHYKDIPIQYSIEEEALGTGGAIRQAFDQYTLEDALVVNGDTFVKADYARFVHECSGNPLAVMLKAVDDANRYGCVETEDSSIVSFHEKRPDKTPGLINAGVYLIHADLVRTFARKKFSFEKDFLETRIASIKPAFFMAEDYFIDIGIPESYMQACRELKQIIGKSACNKALFLDRDGVINVDKHYVHKIEDCEFIDGIFDLCRRAKDKGYKLIVVTNQAGIAKGYFTENDFHTFMEYVRSEFIRQGCPLDDVFYCPYHKDGIGKYKMDSFDRKPNPGMILKAAKKHNIDLKQSILIGDKKSDIEAGKKSGIKHNILIKNISSDLISEVDDIHHKNTNSILK